MERVRSSGRYPHFACQSWVFGRLKAEAPQVSTGNRGVIRTVEPNLSQRSDQASAQCQKAVAEDLHASKRRRGLVSTEEMYDNGDAVYSPTSKLSPTKKVWARLSKNTKRPRPALSSFGSVTGHLSSRPPVPCSLYSVIPPLFTVERGIGWRECVGGRGGA